MRRANRDAAWGGCHLAKYRVSAGWTRLRTAVNSDRSVSIPCARALPHPEADSTRAREIWLATAIKMNVQMRTTQ